MKGSVAESLGLPVFGGPPMVPEMQQKSEENNVGLLLVLSKSVMEFPKDEFIDMADLLHDNLG